MLLLRSLLLHHGGLHLRRHHGMLYGRRLRLAPDIVGLRKLSTIGLLLLLLEVAVVYTAAYRGACTGTKLLHLRAMLLLWMLPLMLLLALVVLLLLKLMMILLRLVLRLAVLPLLGLVVLGLAHAVGVQAVSIVMRPVLLGKLMLRRLRLRLRLLHLVMLAVVMLRLLICIPSLLAGRATTSAGIQVPLARIALAGRERALVCHDGRTMSRHESIRRATASGDRVGLTVALSLSRRFRPLAASLVDRGTRKGGGAAATTLD